MRILLICPVLPVPTTGTGTREFNLIKQLAREHEFVLVTWAPREKIAYAEVVKPYVMDLEIVSLVPFHPPATWVERWRHRIYMWIYTVLASRPHYVHVYPVKEIKRVVRGLLNRYQFDLIHIVGLYCADILNVSRSLPSVLTAIDVETSKQAMIASQEKTVLKRLLWWFELRKLTRYESASFGRFDAVLTMSEEDSVLVRQLASRCKAYLVPNGVDVDYFQCEHTRRDPDRIVFFGNLGYFPNIDAIAYFCHEIWPSILDQLPTAKLDVIGPDATEEIKELAKRSKNVDLIGFVKDIRPHLWTASACVVPLRIGGGTRLKILEALGAGCPVISTSLGATGLCLTPLKDILIADSPDTFANAVLRVMRDPLLRQSLSLNGQKTVASRYDWAKIAAQQAAVYESVVSQRLHRCSMQGAR